MDDDERVVRQVWDEVTSRLDRRADAEAIIADVLARHRESHRRYHTVAHVAWVLRTVEELLTTEPVDDADAVRVAGLFHDAVYDPRAADNEARSAELAARAAAVLGWPVDRTARVERLILATASHDPDDCRGGTRGRDVAVLLDADLSILGAPAPAYADYVRAVRAEYGHVDDAGWRSGRAAVLRSFLERPAIYTTASMRARREVQARANIGEELDSLRR